MSREEAINKIRTIKTTFFGQVVNKYNYAIEVREELSQMAEKGEISPIEFWEAIKIEWPKMSNNEKKSEYTKLNYKEGVI